ERDADEGKADDHGDEALFPPRAEITQADHPLEGAEDHAFPMVTPILATTASMLNSSRAPVLRFLSSTMPLATPLGPTITCQGRPIRSMSANFTPARSSRSSHSTSQPCSLIA